MEILNASSTPPFQLDDYSEAGEDIRLKYRFLDLRRPEMQQRMLMRARIASHVRTYLESQGYWEIETPTLTRATPEGARDYLVPSRTHPGQFFALPQSPQIFKQLLMMSGMDKYYQIARCFRDEDLRADRQPEFTQIDIEASFVDEQDVMALTENMLKSLFDAVLGVTLDDFPVLTWTEAMRLYGSDKPDLRNPLVLVDVADLVSKVQFKVFNGPANDPRGRVAALKAPGAVAVLSRKELDGYVEFVGRYGAKGLAYIKVNDRSAGLDGLQSPILKFFEAQELDTILTRLDAQTGDIVFFGADRANVVNASLGALRDRIARDLDLLEDRWAPCWVVDWPPELLVRVPDLAAIAVVRAPRVRRLAHAIAEGEVGDSALRDPRIERLVVLVARQVRLGRPVLPVRVEEVHEQEERTFVRARLRPFFFGRGDLFLCRFSAPRLLDGDCRFAFFPFPPRSGTGHLSRLQRGHMAPDMDIQVDKQFDYAVAFYSEF